MSLSFCKFLQLFPKQTLGEEIGQVADVSVCVNVVVDVVLVERVFVLVDVEVMVILVVIIDFCVTVMTAVDLWVDVITFVIQAADVNVEVDVVTEIAVAVAMNGYPRPARVSNILPSHRQYIQLQTELISRAKSGVEVVVDIEELTDNEVVDVRLVAGVDIATLVDDPLEGDVIVVGAVLVEVTPEPEATTVEFVLVDGLPGTVDIVTEDVDVVEAGVDDSDAKDIEIAGVNIEDAVAETTSVEGPDMEGVAAIVALDEGIPENEDIEVEDADKDVVGIEGDAVGVVPIEEVVREGIVEDVVLFVRLLTTTGVVELTGLASGVFEGDKAADVAGVVINVVVEFAGLLGNGVDDIPEAEVGVSLDTGVDELVEVEVIVSLAVGIAELDEIEAEDWLRSVVDELFVAGVGTLVEEDVDTIVNDDVVGILEKDGTELLGELNVVKSDKTNV